MQRLLFISLFLIYIAVVSYLCLSRPAGILNVGSWDKIAHTLTYIGFAVLSGVIARNRIQFILLLVLCAAYGVVIEYLQSITGYRTASMNDELANILGLFIGFIFYSVICYVFSLIVLKKNSDTH